MEQYYEENPEEFIESIDATLDKGRIEEIAESILEKAKIPEETRSLGEAQCRCPGAFWGNEKTADDRPRPGS